ncbi:unnamed protein product [Pedinophyceae sp. YPF-701]|nr:unnamed protein product [Pedinophyceae sp. YPF-701]
MSPRRRRFILTALAVAGVYGGYQFFQSEYLRRRLRQVQQQVEALYSSVGHVADAAGAVSEIWTILSQDIADFLVSGQTDVPGTLRQASRLVQSPEGVAGLAAIVQALMRAFEGAAQATDEAATSADGGAQQPAGAPQPQRSPVETILDALLSDRGRTILELVVSRVARESALVMAQQMATTESPGVGEGLASCLAAIADPVHKEAIKEIVSSAAAAAVDAYVRAGTAPPAHVAAAASPARPPAHHPARYDAATPAATHNAAPPTPQRSPATRLAPPAAWTTPARYDAAGTAASAPFFDVNAATRSPTADSVCGPASVPAMSHYASQRTPGEASSSGATTATPGASHTPWQPPPLPQPYHDATAAVSPARCPSSEAESVPPASLQRAGGSEAAAAVAAGAQAAKGGWAAWMEELAVLARSPEARGLVVELAGSCTREAVVAAMSTVGLRWWPRGRERRPGASWWRAAATSAGLWAGSAALAGSKARV